MSSYKDYCQSKYEKAEDLGDRKPIVTIQRVEIETVGSGKDQADKPVLYFAEPKIKPFVVNKVNGEAIEEIAGTDDLDLWPGTKIQLYATKTEFAGKRVPCIRVCEPPARPVAKAVPAVKAAAPRARIEALPPDFEENAPADDEAADGY